MQVNAKQIDRPFHGKVTCHNGFTLIELMLVVAVIGALASILVPEYTPYMQRAKSAEAMTMTSGFRRAIAEYYAHRGRFPADNKAAGLLEPEQLPGKYVKSVEVENGALHIVFIKGTFQEEVELLLTIRPSVVEAYPQGNSVTWLCGYASPAEGMMAFGENRTSIAKENLSQICW